ARRLWRRREFSRFRFLSLDPQRPLFRCGGCQAWYHEASVRALDLDNGGRCALCGSPDLRAVRML
ncbi:MAG: hypothetical protein KJ018_18295, partial [Burkholderiales bacterium]|nr:hypothetical protein [Burkholderiales bacterium]